MTATTSARRSLSLAEAGAVFWRYPSPWIISGFLAAAVVARLLVGGFTIVDAIVIAATVAAQPFVEWMVHVFLLHWRPREVLGRVVDPLFARKHREHHTDPRDTELVFIPTPVVLQLVVLEVVASFVIAPRAGLALTYLVATGVVGIVYEWTHYLVHTDYRPKTRPYRAVWRNHRLHHYKNENYWFSVTSTISDRVLGTAPDPSEIETSPTARNLLGVG